MKVYVKAYINKNLGDDLFIKIITERYPNVDFVLLEDAKYLAMPNVTYLKNNSIIKNFNNILKAITLGFISYQSIQMKRCDLSVLIGGSIFMESNNKLEKFISLLIHKPSFDYILGINFGPFYSSGFYKKYYKYFQKAKSVSFRDSYSYELFKNLKNTKKALDIVFSLNTENYNITNRKRVIISVIDCDNRFDEITANNYYEKICEIIQYYQRLKYNICLMSFCKKEGDEKAINKILSMLRNKEEIETYLYDGKLEEAINVIADSEIVVGTRFHANIIGMLLGKKIIPISYSDKMSNVLKDINFKGIRYDIRNMDDFDIKKLENLDNNIVDISNFKEDSNKHFEELDKGIIKEREKSEKRKTIN